MTLPDYVGTGELAGLLGMTDQRIVQLVNQKVLPREGRGRYPLAACIQSYIAYTKALAEKSPEAICFEVERARKTKAEADIAEMKAAEQAGQLVRKEAVVETWGKVLIALRAALLAFPTKHARRLFASATIEETRAILDESIREVMTDLSDAE